MNRLGRLGCGAALWLSLGLPAHATEPETLPLPPGARPQWLDARRLWLRAGPSAPTERDRVYDAHTGQLTPAPWPQAADGTARFAVRDESGWIWRWPARSSEPPWSRWDGQIANESLTVSRARADDPRVALPLPRGGILVGSAQGLAWLGRDGEPLRTRTLPDGWQIEQLWLDARGEPWPLLTPHDAAQRELRILRPRVDGSWHTAAQLDPRRDTTPRCEDALCLWSRDGRELRWLWLRDGEIVRRLPLAAAERTEGIQSATLALITRDGAPWLYAFDAERAQLTPLRALDPTSTPLRHARCGDALWVEERDGSLVWHEKERSLLLRAAVGVPPPPAPQRAAPSVDAPAPSKRPHAAARASAPPLQSLPRLVTVASAQPPWQVMEVLGKQAPGSAADDEPSMRCVGDHAVRVEPRQVQRWRRPR